MVQNILMLTIVFSMLGGSAHAAPGIVLLAHGGNADWNARVTELAAAVDRTTPTEVAFGMATRANIQAAIDRLVARGVSEIVAVPLFISSWSSIVTSTEYLLGLRDEAPPALARYARMNHAPPHGSASARCCGRRPFRWHCWRWRWLSRLRTRGTCAGWDGGSWAEACRRSCWR